MTVKCLLLKRPAGAHSISINAMNKSDKSKDDQDKLLMNDENYERMPTQISLGRLKFCNWGSNFCCILQTAPFRSSISTRAFFVCTCVQCIWPHISPFSVILPDASSWKIDCHLCGDKIQWKWSLTTALLVRLWAVRDCVSVKRKSNNNNNDPILRVKCEWDFFIAQKHTKTLI